MPTVLTHIAVPIAGRLGLGVTRVPAGMLALGMALAVLPDADVILMRFGVPYESEFGHRGASHSIAFALLVSTIAAAAYAAREPRAFRSTWAFLFCCAVSHPLLDALTDGGHGPALLWPIDETRYFAPLRPIEVSPLDARRFLGERGARVLLSEVLWVWLPLLAVGFVRSRWRR